MSIVVRLHCDGCNRERGWCEGFRRDSPPPGWHYWARTEDGGDGADDAHFCSWECFIVWANRARPTDRSRLPVRMVAS